MFNYAKLMPRFIRQTMSLLALLPHEAAYLSIYESNSSDTTGNSPISWHLLYCLAGETPSKDCTREGATCKYVLLRAAFFAGRWLKIFEQLLELFAYPHSIIAQGQGRSSDLRNCDGLDS